MVLLQLDHLDKVAVARINCISTSLNAASQDVSSRDNIEEDKNKAYLEKDFKTQSPNSGAEGKTVRQLGESKLQAT